LASSTICDKQDRFPDNHLKIYHSEEMLGKGLQTPVDLSKTKNLHRAGPVGWGVVEKYKICASRLHWQKMAMKRAYIKLPIP
jgi:hypothetical protein